MKKLSKRFLTLAIACVMAMAMAVPAFAADYTNGRAGYTSRYRSFGAQTGCGYLNIYHNSGTAVKQGDSLRVWEFGALDDQYFKSVKTSGGYLVLKPKASYNNVEYSLMVNRSTAAGHPAILWSGTSAYFDSNLKCTGNTSTGFRFQLANYTGEYLNAEGGSNGSLIDFKTGVGTYTSSLWK